jgi:hypothetical protein
MGHLFEGITSFEEGSMSQKEKEEGQLRVKISDDVLRGVYANQMVISHTKEEFILDFMNLFPPEGVVNARVIISPGHMKRILNALTRNLQAYEQKFGPVEESAPPPGAKAEIH